jgi:hypothetical protein
MARRGEAGRGGFSSLNDFDSGMDGIGIGIWDWDLGLWIVDWVGFGDGIWEMGWKISDAGLVLFTPFREPFHTNPTIVVVVVFLFHLLTRFPSRWFSRTEFLPLTTDTPSLTLVVFLF